MADAKSNSVDNSTPAPTDAPASVSSAPTSTSPSAPTTTLTDAPASAPEKTPSKIEIESKKHRGPGAKVKVQTNKPAPVPPPAAPASKSDTPTSDPAGSTPVKPNTKLTESQIKVGRVKVRSFSQLEAPTKPQPVRPKADHAKPQLTPEMRAQLNHEAYRQSHLSKTGQHPAMTSKPKSTPALNSPAMTSKPKSTPALNSLDAASVKPTFAPLSGTKKVEKTPRPKKHPLAALSKPFGLKSPLWLTTLLGILLVAVAVFALTRPAPEAASTTVSTAPQDTVSTIYEFKNFEDSDRVYSEPNWGMRRSFKVNNVPVSDYLKISRVDASDPSSRDFVLSVDEAAYKIYDLKGKTKDYEFTTNKRVRQIIIGIVGQSAGQEGLVIVYADGTLAYQRMAEILENGKVEPHATDLKDIVTADVVTVHDAKNETSWATTIAVKDDGTFYDLQKYLDPEN